MGAGFMALSTISSMAEKARQAKVRRRMSFINDFYLEKDGWDYLKGGMEGILSSKKELIELIQDG